MTNECSAVSSHSNVLVFSWHAVVSTQPSVDSTQPFVHANSSPVLIHGKGNVESHSKGGRMSSCVCVCVCASVCVCVCVSVCVCVNMNIVYAHVHEQGDPRHRQHQRLLAAPPHQPHPPHSRPRHPHPRPSHGHHRLRRRRDAQQRHHQPQPRPARQARVSTGELRANPLVRVIVKFTVKNSVCDDGAPVFGDCACDRALTLKSGAAQLGRRWCCCTKSTRVVS